MSETQRAKELAEAHWNGYVKPLLHTHGASDELINVVGFHYISATVHGHKHGVEDERSGLFRPRIGEVTQYAPAHPYLHKDEVRNCNTCHSDTCKQIGSGKEGCSCWVDDPCGAADYTPLSPSEVKEIAESVAPSFIKETREPLCDTCREADTCRGPHRGAGCAGYNSPPSDEWEGKAAPLSLSLPSITVEGDLEEVRKKYQEEFDEWLAADSGTLHSFIEAWDVIQVRQTFAERGGDVRELWDEVSDRIQGYHRDNPDLLATALRATLIKNAARFYYSPEVNERIILSGGYSW